MVKNPLGEFFIHEFIYQAFTQMIINEQDFRF